MLARLPTRYLAIWCRRRSSFCKGHARILWLPCSFLFVLDQAASIKLFLSNATFAINNLKSGSNWVECFKLSHKIRDLQWEFDMQNECCLSVMRVTRVSSWKFLTWLVFWPCQLRSVCLKKWACQVNWTGIEEQIEANQKLMVDQFVVWRNENFDWNTKQLICEKQASKTSKALVHVLLW